MRQKAKIRSNTKGRYSEFNKKWLGKNVGNAFSCEIHNMNYVIFENELLCHVYDCTVIDVETEEEYEKRKFTCKCGKFLQQYRDQYRENKVRSTIIFSCTECMVKDREAKKTREDNIIERLDKMIELLNVISEQTKKPKLMGMR